MIRHSHCPMILTVQNYLKPTQICIWIYIYTYTYINQTLNYGPSPSHLHQLELIPAKIGSSKPGTAPGAIRAALLPAAFTISPWASRMASSSSASFGRFFRWGFFCWLVKIYSYRKPWGGLPIWGYINIYIYSLYWCIFGEFVFFVKCQVWGMIWLVLWILY